MRKLLGISNSDTGGGGGCQEWGKGLWGGPTFLSSAGGKPAWECAQVCVHVRTCQCVCTCAYVNMCMCTSGRTKVSQPREQRVTVVIRKLGWGQSQEYKEGSGPGRNRTLTE